MTLKPLQGFQPLKTHHCVTGSMRNIYEFYGYPISEDLLLGLGAGVGFVYWHMKGNLPFYGGRAKRGWRRLLEGERACVSSLSDGQRSESRKSPAPHARGGRAGDDPG
jgi:hypothetical protein